MLGVVKMMLVRYFQYFKNNLYSVPYMIIP